MKAPFNRSEDVVMGSFIFWRKNLQQVLAEAPTEGKPVFMNFFNPG